MVHIPEEDIERSLRNLRPFLDEFIFPQIECDTLVLAGEKKGKMPSPELKVLIARYRKVIRQLQDLDRRHESLLVAHLQPEELASKFADIEREREVLYRAAFICFAESVLLDRVEAPVVIPGRHLEDSQG